VGLEIERKFLVEGSAWRTQARRSTPMSQFYLATRPECSIRVRIAGGQATLNIKGSTIGASRPEFEYPLPLDDARAMLACLGGPSVEKTRHWVEHCAHTWEVDEFGGANARLVVAEIELSDTQEAFERPVWLGREVTNDARYYNMALAERPWSDWSDARG
jgi:adenylate cyclase